MTQRRPRSIVLFERVVLFGLSAFTLHTWLTWDFWLRAHARAGVAIAIISVEIGLNLLFVWLIARKASSLTRWIYLCLVAVSLLGLIDYKAMIPFGTFALALFFLPYLTSLVSVWLLLREDSARWLLGVRDVDPDIFR
jgi:hypothetical protein